MTVRIDHTLTSGTFSLDGETFEVDNNVWVIGDDSECLVIDAPHDVAAITEVIGERVVRAIVCTHAHDDHVRVAHALADTVGAPVLLHPSDLLLWRQVHDAPPDDELSDGQRLEVAGIGLRVLHTPGHSPGSCCLYSSQLGVVFTGDTLFQGGPGATGRSFSDRGLIIRSIRDRLFTLPPETVVKTGHGPDTTIEAEQRALM
ncbi:MAG: MBL fold metallo-hydrolase [Propionibacteriaceae bacterium]|nr:MBL fold metallo-hydrolase [Propionibacteriaceae bacterium]